MRISKAAMIAPALCMAQPVAAGPFEDGYAALKRQDFATALKLWHSLAEEGNSKAQFAQGLMYLVGAGLPPKSTESEKWLR